MKRICLISLLFTFSGFALNAQKLSTVQVPAPVKEAFAKQYPGISAKWEKEQKSYEANFKQNGNILSASYESNGTFIESELDIKVSDLPASIKEYVKAKYSDKTIKEAARISRAGGTINYEAEVNGKDLLFTDQGKFIKESKD